MDRHKTRDEIDLELSRTYFGNTEGKKKPPKPGETTQQKKAPQEMSKNTHYPARRSWSSLKVLFIIWVLSGIIFISGYFVRDKRIVLNLNVNLEPFAGSVEQASLPETKPNSSFKTLPVTTSRPETESLPSKPAAKDAKTFWSFLPKTLPVATSKAEPESSPPVSTAHGLKTLYDFEKDEEGWEIPLWELEKPDHVARSLKKIETIASKGNGSLEMNTEFPGGAWTAALAEIQQYLDLMNYNLIQADVYLPDSCPSGLRGKLILTVGEDWRFVEMARGIRLIPGQWTTITASISENSNDWRRTIVDDRFKSDIRKVAIRIESNMKPAYSGPVYIDNIRVSSVEGDREANKSPGP